MKGLFPQYDYSPLSEPYYADAWDTALFVFDTNVLLNLYRYQERTREELFETLEQLTNRVWIPHHVALEFQRNRLNVIAAQGRRFSEIRKVIEKSKSDLTNGINSLKLAKRHTLINPEPLTAGFQKLTDEFLAILDKLQESQQTLTGPDPIKIRLEDIFEGKVGEAHQSQADVDIQNKLAEARHKTKIPPGYKDDEKDKDDPDEFAHNGLIYKKKFGDFFVWSQLLKHAENSNYKKLIFITDDAKEDWWKQVDLDGTKTLGARPELIEEAKNIGKLEAFLMYKPETFLKYANNFLAAKISEETLREVRDVSLENRKKRSLLRDPSDPNASLHIELINWILTKHPMLEEHIGEYISFIANDNNQNHGYALCLPDAPDSIEILNKIKLACRTAALTTFATITTVILLNNNDDTISTMDFLMRNYIKDVPSNIIIAIGYYDKNNAQKNLRIVLDEEYNTIVPF